MKMQLLAALLGATALTVGAGESFAAQTSPPSASTRDDMPPPPATGPMRGGGLMRADTNRDGVVTRDEVIGDADRRFARMDTDGDGKVSRDELRAARAARRGPPGADMDAAPPRTDTPPPSDARGDDRPRRAMRAQTRDVARERALRMFDRTDTNHDGRVDAQEIEAMRLMMRARFAGSERDDDGSALRDEQR